ncbi:hypothetical protein LCGC14_1938970 [marine sediment metagenome]|uniref:Uncharacterized protein n=1 Tax=marine sediment metagenome TaxID=412755 RepID=A0A0F9FKU5_9ZZZZ
MTHAELRFSYRCPAACIKNGLFCYAGPAFRYVEAERDSIAMAQKSWYPSAKKRRAFQAVNWLGRLRLSAYNWGGIRT